MTVSDVESLYQKIAAMSKTGDFGPPEHWGSVPL